MNLISISIKSLIDFRLKKTMASQDFNINEFLETSEDNKSITGGFSEFLEEYTPVTKSVTGGAVSKQDPTNDKLIPNIITECSLVKVFKTDQALRKDNMICFEDETVEKLKQHVMRDMMKNAIENTRESGNTGGETNNASNVGENIIQVAKSKFGCSDDNAQSCILHHAAKSGIISPQEAAKEFMENFKIKGPTNSDLLSNFNIDDTLHQWERLFKDFYAYEFNMVDFKEHGKSLATTRIREDIYDKGYRTFACVINSDSYSGQGKHWMALFGDMRADLSRESSDNAVWSVEFFNSAGNPPQKSFAGWLLESCEAMKQIAAEKYGVLADNADRVRVIKVSDIMHQYSRTECGVYSLYYIWARLHGISPEYFKKKDDLVSDILCFEFRQHLFDDSRRKPMKQFDYDKFAEFGGVKWENDIPRAKINHEISRAKAGPSGLTAGRSTQHVQTGRGAQHVQTGRSAQHLQTGHSRGVVHGASIVSGSGKYKKNNSQHIKYGGSGVKPDKTLHTDLGACINRKHVGADIYDEVKREIFDEVLVTEEEKAEYKKQVPFNMQLLDSTPSLPYRRRGNELKISLHWGQRKLLMTEIFFLAKFSALSKTVLYAGSAPGTHIPFLLEIFPRHKFILYDPRDFSPSLRPFEKSGRVEIHQEYMTNDVAKKFQGEDILFVSDIRTDPTEKGVHADMLMQQEWHAIMNPLVSMFKFRLPYTNSGDEEDANANPSSSKGFSGDIDKYPYLDGEIFIQPWAPTTSTETRLLAYRFEGKSPPMRDYNSTKYEAQMFRHSLITRQLQNFKHCVCGEGIDYCWDCRAEIEILAMYLASQQYPGDPSKAASISDEFIVANAKTISGLSRRISKIIGQHTTLITPPHGIYKDIPAEDRVVNLFVKYRPLIVARKELRVAWSFQQRVKSREVGLITRAEEAVTRVFLMRHGETDGNARGMIHGPSLDPALNLALNRIGRAQVREIGKIFSGVGFGAVYSSPSARTIETANIVLGENLAATQINSNDVSRNHPRVNVVVVEDLHDLDVGPLEGKTKEEAVEIMKSRGFDYDKIRSGLIDSSSEIPRDLMKESYSEYNARICGAIEKLVIANQGKTILIVGHARMGVFANYLRGAELKPAELGNANVLTFIINGDVKKTFAGIRRGKPKNVDILTTLKPITYKLFC